MKWTLLCISLCLWAGCKAQPSGQPDDTGQDMTAALTCDNMRCANPDAVCCDGVPCIDTTADPQNCGGCGKACSGQEACRDSRCVCGGGGAQTACTLGTSCCGDGPGYTGGCKDLTLDPANCGACMHACPTSETCSGSACKCGAGPGCTAPKQCCTAGADAGAAAACVDTSQDDNNCGACGHKCSAGHPCKGGTCQGECMGCTMVQTCCDGTCANLLNDQNNCGKCGMACPTVLGFQLPCLLGKCVELHHDMGMPPPPDMR